MKDDIDTAEMKEWSSDEDVEMKEWRSSDEDGEMKEWWSSDEEGEIESKKRQRMYRRERVYPKKYGIKSFFVGSLILAKRVFISFLTFLSIVSSGTIVMLIASSEMRQHGYDALEEIKGHWQASHERKINIVKDHKTQIEPSAFSSYNKRMGKVFENTPARNRDMNDKDMVIPHKEINQMPFLFDSMPSQGPTLQENLIWVMKKIFHNILFTFLTFEVKLEEVLEQFDYFVSKFNHLVFYFFSYSEEDYELNNYILKSTYETRFNNLKHYRDEKNKVLFQFLQKKVPFFDKTFCWWNIEQYLDENDNNKSSSRAVKENSDSNHISSNTLSYGPEDKSGKKKKKKSKKRTYTSILEGILSDNETPKGNPATDIIDLTRLDSMEASMSILQSASLDEMHELLEDWSVNGIKKNNNEVEYNQNGEDGNIALKGENLQSKSSSASNIEKKKEEKNNKNHFLDKDGTDKQCEEENERKLDETYGWRNEPLYMEAYLSQSYKAARQFMRNISDNVEEISKSKPTVLDEFSHDNPYFMEELVRSKCKCSIDRYQMANLSVEKFNKYFRNKRPVIIQGAMNLWPAMRTWSKEELIENYGERILKVGSGNEIVSSGGGYGVSSLTFGDYLISLEKTLSPSPEFDLTNSHLNKKDQDGKRIDSFSFDTTFTNFIPELLGDFAIPSYFRSFASPGHIKRQSAWYMLSIGGSKQGLPFHAHGETWLGLVNGQKRWFVYPPGKGLQERRKTKFENDDHSISSKERTTKVTALNYSVWPLLNAFEWFQLIYPNLSAVTHSSHKTKHNANDVYNHPEDMLECIQNKGDVLYLPAGWKHMTLNIGETIAVGGQAAYGADARLKDGLQVLMNAPTISNSKGKKDERNDGENQSSPLSVENVAWDEQKNNKEEEAIESAAFDYEAQMAVGIGYAHKALEIVIQVPSNLIQNSSSSSSSSTSAATPSNKGVNQPESKLQEYRAKEKVRRESIAFQRYKKQKLLKEKYLNQSVAHLKAAIAARPCAIDPYLLLAEVLYSYDENVIAPDEEINKKIEEADVILDHAQDLFNHSDVSPCFITKEKLSLQFQNQHSLALFDGTSESVRRLYASLQIKISRFYLGTQNYAKAQDILINRVLSIDDKYPDAHADLMLVNYFLFRQAKGDLHNLQNSELLNEDGPHDREEMQEKLQIKLELARNRMVTYKESAASLGYIPTDMYLKGIIGDIENERLK